MIQSYLDEYKSVRDAIMRLTADPASSQTVSSANGGSYSVSYQSLPALYDREKYLVSFIAEMSRGGVGLSYPLYC